MALALLAEKKASEAEALQIGIEEVAVPHYQLPNFSSILPEYTNSEQDYIKGAFSCSNFASITKVPNDLKPTEISKARNSNVCVDFFIL